MQNRRLIVRHAILSFVFVVLFFVLNRPEVIFVSQLGLSAWYPATGLLLALMLGINPWYIVLVCLCNVLSGVVFYHRTFLSFIDSAGSLGIGIPYAVAAYVLRGPLKIDLGLRRRRDVVRYIFVTMVAAAATTAVGIGSLVLGGAISRNVFWPAAYEWFLGDGIALLGVAPFLLIHVLPWVRARLSQGTAEDARHHERYRGEAVRFRLPALVEGVGQAAAIAAILWVMFGPRLGDHGLFYLGLVPIIWIAMRQGIRRAVSGILAFNFGIVVAVHLFLPIAGVIPKLGLFMLVVSGVGLVTGSAVSERHRIALELQEQTNHLNLLIANSPFGIVVLDPRGRVELSNAAFEKLSLFDRAELSGMDFECIFASGSVAPEVIPSVRTALPGDSLPTAVRRLRRDGHMLDLEVYAVPLAADGRVHGSYMIFKDISEQIRASEAESQYAQALKRLVTELQLRTRQMTLLSEMGDLLEVCATTQEACAVVAQSVQKLLPDVISGTLYLFRSSRNLVEASIQWGNAGFSEAVFAPDACWGLRRGQPHWNELAGGINCAHLSPAASNKCLCVPMAGHGDMMGILHLEFASEAGVKAEPGADTMEVVTQYLATTVSGQIALSLASLRLRETLRDQSIRDPLTGLFNRRFMEESLEREMQRGIRKNHPVSVLFIDLDHFKRFNDTFGHDAGDFVLRSIADLFKRLFRVDDVICRYGGEEFGIILPESSSENAVVRANALREAAKKMEMRYKNRSLGMLTLSVGVATFPEHGGSSEELLKTADQCLYKSKAGGRDQVTVAAHRIGDRDPANKI